MNRKRNRNVLPKKCACQTWCRVCGRWIARCKLHTY